MAPYPHRCLVLSIFIFFFNQIPSSHGRQKDLSKIMSDHFSSLLKIPPILPLLLSPCTTHSLALHKPLHACFSRLISLSPPTPTCMSAHTSIHMPSPSLCLCFSLPLSLCLSLSLCLCLCLFLSLSHTHTHMHLLWSSKTKPRLFTSPNLPCLLFFFFLPCLRLFICLEYSLPLLQGVDAYQHADLSEMSCPLGMLCSRPRPELDAFPQIGPEPLASGITVSVHGLVIVYYPPAPLDCGLLNSKISLRECALCPAYPESGFVQ